MSKVTSKLQLTLPKAIADEFGIRPGDELLWETAGEVIRVVPERSSKTTSFLTPRERLALFDAATTRQQKREAGSRRGRKRPPTSTDRGWTREDLYRRGFSH